MEHDVVNRNRLDENKRFIIDAFDIIGENPSVLVSGTTEIAKTAEPELYDSMLSKGRDILPAVLSLMAETAEHSRRFGELTMLCNDILESLGEPVLYTYKPVITSEAFINLYEAYLDESPPQTRVATHELSDNFEVTEPAYVWSMEVDPSVYIPEPENIDNPPPKYVRWEPMLGKYVYRDAYYNKELGMIILDKWPE